MQPGGFDFGALMQSAAAMQEQMAHAQASLADERATGSAGGGLVTAEVDGNGQLVGLTIDPSVVDPDDVETLADLVVAAVRDGARAAEALAQQKMGAVAGGMLGGLPEGLQIPGLPGDVPGLAGTAEG
jgi:DNA-binding YbaB/EbfC family protein